MIITPHLQNWLTDTHELSKPFLVSDPVVKEGEQAKLHHGGFFNFVDDFLRFYEVSSHSALEAQHILEAVLTEKWQRVAWLKTDQRWNQSAN